MSGPMFWTEYTDPENKNARHQAAVIAVDIKEQKALILAPGKARRTIIIPLEDIMWSRWD